MVLRMTSSGYKVRGCPGSIPGWVLKKEKSTNLIYIYYIPYMLYILYISNMNIIYLIYCIYT